MPPRKHCPAFLTGVLPCPSPPKHGSHPCDSLVPGSRYISWSRSFSVSNQLRFSEGQEQQERDCGRGVRRGRSRSDPVRMTQQIRSLRLGSYTSPGRHSFTFPKRLCTITSHTYNGIRQRGTTHTFLPSSRRFRMQCCRQPLSPLQSRS